MGVRFRKAVKFLVNRQVRFDFLSSQGLYNHMPDEEYIKKQFKVYVGKELDLGNPQTFNEKMQWLKLNDRKLIYTKLVDKYLVRGFVEMVLGKEFLIPLLGVWDLAEEIDFDKLPDKFVLKCNHNSGEGMCICKGKSQIDFVSVKAKLNYAMRRNYWWHAREWPYKNVERKIIAEKYMEDESGTELKDYKLFTFSGKVKYIEVDYNRFTDHHRNFYTTEWEYVPFTTCYPTNPKYKIPRPRCLEKLVESAEKLACAAGVPKFVRVDMYIVNDKLYFGEMTFYHGAGYEKFMPQEYDLRLGDMIEL